MDELKNSVLKTGTTILGIVCKDGIVLASDRQVSAGTMVMKKNKEKTIKINDYLLYAGAGVASAIQRTAKLLGAELRLKEIRSKVRPSVKQAASLTANMVYQNVRQFTRIEDVVGALIAGVNEDGTFELYTLDPSGHIDLVDDYDANFGSGMPFSLGLLERQYKKGVSVKEAIELAKEALLSSTQRDMGSGYGIDIYTITKEGIKKVFETELKAELKAK
jgi:proteasome beta subunit